MSGVLVFMDTETTGLALRDDIWEFAAVRRQQDGSEGSLHLFIDHDKRKCAQLPESFREDHAKRWPGDGGYVSKREAATLIAAFFGEGRPHVVGAVPNFDTERVATLLRRGGIRREPWHYHLIDVENLAVGYLMGQRRLDPDDYAIRFGGDFPPLPWDSDLLSAACGVEPPTDERHTAMGDVRWAMALYDAITTGRR